MFNDADIEMAELTARGNDIAHGICPICEDVLDPLLARWEGTQWPKTIGVDGTVRETTAEEYAACVGPASTEVPGYHKYCIEEETS